MPFFYFVLFVLFGALISFQSVSFAEGVESNLGQLAVSGSSSKATDEPIAYLKTGLADSISAEALHFGLAKNWTKYAHLEHFDRAGFFQIYLDVLGKRPWFPFFAGLMDSSRLRFMNFGAHGFFVGFAMRGRDDLQTESLKTRQPSAQVALASKRSFESLEWGVTYLTPHTISDSRFLRDYFVQTHGMSQARRAVDALMQKKSETHVSEAQKSHFEKQDLRQGYLIVWSGGIKCLASLQDQGKAVSKSAPNWMKCDPDTGLKIRELDDLSDDEQFYYMISGRPSAEQLKVCKAVGTLDSTGIEGFGVISGPKGRCLNYRSRFEDKWGTRSKVHCLLPLESKHLWANFDHVDFSFPTASSDVFVLVESRYAPPRLTQVDLAQAEYLTLKANRPGHEDTLDIRGAGSADFSGLPRDDYGMYQCLVQSRGNTLRQLFFVPKDVYLGQRQVDVDEDLVYSYSPSRERVVQSEVLNWKQVMEKYPSLDRFPEMSCAYELSIDIRCGVKVMQTASQVIWEFENGTFQKVTSPAVQRAALALTESLLENVDSRLVNWGLRDESEYLRDKITFYLKGVEGNHEQSQAQRSDRALALQNSWRSYLSVPSRFWSGPEQ